MDQQSILDQLRAKGPESWLAYLRPFEEGEPITGLSMLVIFDYTAPIAKEQESLDWAEIGIRAIELEARNSSGVERDNALLEAMRLRSWFIARKGSRPGQFVLDKQIVLRWVTDGLTLPVPGAKEQSSAFWENLRRAKSSPNPEDMRHMAKTASQLRWIKHRLSIVKVLADCGEIADDSVLQEWLQLRESLP